jgi:hypothetical protein
MEDVLTDISHTAIRGKQGKRGITYEQKDVTLEGEASFADAAKPHWIGTSAPK